MATSKATLTKYFLPGSKPSAAQFAELIESYPNLKDGPIRLDEDGGLVSVRAEGATTPVLKLTEKGELTIGGTSGKVTATELAVTGSQRVGGGLSVGGSLDFSGSDKKDRFGQHIHLWGTSHGIGLQSNTTYLRTAGQFEFYVGGAHAAGVADAGGGKSVLSLNVDGVSAIVRGAARVEGNLQVTGNVRQDGDLPVYSTVHRGRVAWGGTAEWQNAAQAQSTPVKQLANLPKGNYRISAFGLMTNTKTDLGSRVGVFVAALSAQASDILSLHSYNPGGRAEVKDQSLGHVTIESSADVASGAQSAFWGESELVVSQDCTYLGIRPSMWGVGGGATDFVVVEIARK